MIKTISTGLSKPLSQLMAGVRDIGSLDSDRGFLNSLASGVTSVANVANSMVDVFKDRVQAIYPGEHSTIFSSTQTKFTLFKKQRNKTVCF